MNTNKAAHNENARRTRDGTWKPSRGLAMQLCGHIPKCRRCKCTTADSYNVETSWKVPTRHPKVVGCNGMTCQCDPQKCHDMTLQYKDRSKAQIEFNAYDVSKFKTGNNNSNNNNKNYNINYKNNDKENKNTNNIVTHTRTKNISEQLLERDSLNQIAVSADDESVLGYDLSSEWLEVDIPFYQSDASSPKPHPNPLGETNLRSEPISFDERFTGIATRKRSLTEVIAVAAKYTPASTDNKQKLREPMNKTDVQTSSNQYKGALKRTQLAAEISPKQAKNRGREYRKVTRPNYPNYPRKELVTSFRATSDNEVLPPRRSNLVNSAETLNHRNKHQYPRRANVKASFQPYLRAEPHNGEPNRKLNVGDDPYRDTKTKIATASHGTSTIEECMQSVNRNIVQNIYSDYSHLKRAFTGDQRHVTKQTSIPVVEDFIQKEHIILMMVTEDIRDNGKQFEPMTENQPEVRKPSEEPKEIKKKSKLTKKQIIERYLKNNTEEIISDTLKEDTNRRSSIDRVKNKKTLIEKEIYKNIALERESNRRKDIGTVTTNIDPIEKVDSQSIKYESNKRTSIDKSTSTEILNSTPVVEAPNRASPESKTMQREAKIIRPASKNVIRAAKTTQPESNIVRPESKTLLRESKTMRRELKTIRPESKNVMRESKTLLRESKTMRREVIDRTSSPIYVMPLYAAAPPPPIPNIVVTEHDNDPEHTITTTRHISSDPNVAPVTTVSRELDEGEVLGDVRERYSKEIVREVASANQEATSMDCFGYVVETNPFAEETYRKSISRQDVVTYNTIRPNKGGASNKKRVSIKELPEPIDEPEQVRTEALAAHARAVRKTIERRKSRSRRESTRSNTSKNAKNAKSARRHSSRKHSGRSDKLVATTTTTRRRRSSVRGGHKRDGKQTRRSSCRRHEDNSEDDDNPCVINIFNQTKKTMTHSAGASSGAADRCECCRRTMPYYPEPQYSTDESLYYHSRDPYGYYD